MNRKGSEGAFWIVVSAIACVIIIVIVLWANSKGLKTAKELAPSDCPSKYCVSASEGCEQWQNGVLYITRKLDCDENGDICCVPSTDPLATDSSEDTSESTTSIAGSNVQTGQIHITLNDALTEMSASSLTMETGKTYLLHISGEGYGSDSCTVQVLDQSSTKIEGASWIAGTFSDMSCTSAQTITLTPTYEQSGKKYTMQIVLMNKTTNKITESSNIALSVGATGTGTVVVNS